MRHYTTEYNKKMLSTNRAWGKKEKKEKEKKKDNWAPCVEDISLYNLRNCSVEF